MTAQEPGPAAAIQLRGVARRFGQRWVLRGADLVVHPGEVLVLTGRNGSGKTTLLRIVGTLLRPTRGTAEVFGHDTVRGAAAIRESVGMLGHNAALYDDLTAAENLVFSLRMAGRPAPAVDIAAALDHVGLATVRNERVRGFSAGMRRRLGLARLMLRPPRLLLLDEPYASFDQDGIDVVNEFALETARAGGVVLLTTHDMTRAVDVMSRRVHVADGRLTEVHDGHAAHSRLEPVAARVAGKGGVA
ncbi:MAG TPA: heme ABC exporter ATP-binding protein CcmA [Longimicrobiales bacterium]|nr:heme ABC exporter ATP-binding protein CcmA [Longimicrobiales bacterium]